MDKDLFSRTNLSEKSNENSQETIETDAKVTPSPVFPTRFKATEKSKENEAKNQTRKTSEKKELHPSSGKDHGATCGCHDCFTSELRNVNELTKDSIINVIRNFILSRKNSEVDDIESHTSNCMCVEHLIFYRENKIKIIDKLLKSRDDVDKTNEPPIEANVTPDRKVKIVRTRNNPENEL